MAGRQLRVFFGPQAGNTVISSKQQSNSTTCHVSTHDANPKTVTLPLGDIIESLADAVNCDRNWVSDFSDEPISISSDLHQVILAYAEQQLRRSA